MIGQTISHYRITEKLGEGGMGVVYKAEDTKLERTVALKFLAAHLLNDHEAKQRFLREARAAAALNHPNICTVHEIDEAEGQTFIAMALVEGESLEEGIAGGPLPIKDALDIARQVANGLQAAHDKGIIHRDIKPANILLDTTGHATIMDFGLARLTEASRLTKADTTMGTVAYMSPEQAQGMEVDNRSDIWALGVVLYEMVRGQRPFQGEYDQALLFEIVQQEPEPLTGVRVGVPIEVEFFVGKCLAKDPADRYGNAGEIAKDLRTLGEKLKSGRSTILRTGVAAGSQAIPTSPVRTESPSGPHPLVRYRVIEDIKQPDDSIKYLAEDTELRRSVAIRVLTQSSAEQIERAQRRKQAILLGATALAVLLALVFAFFPLFFSSPVAEAPLRRFALTTHEAPLRPSISPNGRHVAYLGGQVDNRSLWVQDLDQNQPRAIVGPTVMRGDTASWSPDSEFVGFQSEGGWNKVAVSGGPVVTLADYAGVALGSAWTPDGESLIFSSAGGLYRVPARGGTAELWLEAEQEGFLAIQPAFFPASPDANKLLYVEATSPLDAQILALDRASGQREILVEGSSPVYSPSGHVIYGRVEPRGVWAIPFSVDTMKATGDPFPIIENSRYPSVSLEMGRWLIWKDKQRPASNVWSGATVRETVWERLVSPRVRSAIRNSHQTANGSSCAAPKTASRTSGFMKSTGPSKPA